MADAGTFHYRAVAADGRRVRGQLTATDREAAIRTLRQRGELPVRVEPHGVWRLSLAQPSRLSGRHAAELFASLSMLLHSGVKLDTALDLLADSNESATVARTAVSLRARVREGAGLAAALAQDVAGLDPVAVAMIRAGEEAGDLAQAAARVAAQLAATRAAAQRARAALAYPALVVLAAVATVILIATVVVPAFLPLFADRGAPPPLALALLAGLGALLAGWWPVGLAVLAAIGLGLRAALSRPGFRLRCHRTLLALPRLGRMLVLAELGRFARALGALVEGGVRLPQALALARGVLRNTALAAGIAAATASVRAGDSLAAALGTVAHLPPAARHMLQVGERSGQLAVALHRIAEHCERDVTRATERVLALLGPALVIGLGGMVALVISTLLTAVLDANQLVAP
jgi:general secretion pathway protein F